jgi:hypothetical protein
MELGLLGPPEVTSADKPVAGAGRSSGLLVLLLLRAAEADAAVARA